MSSKAERLLHCYDLLIRQAATGRTISYSSFAFPLGVAARGISSELMPVLNWCRCNSHPELPIIVVRKDTGRPSGPYEANKIESQTKLVFQYDWTAVDRPTEAELLAFRKSRPTANDHPGKSVSFHPGPSF